jgi:hypothetical protein
LRFSQPGYCLLSGDVPMAIWKGADNGSQMGVYLGIQETEAVTNVQIRSLEYLPANLERGVFLIPSRTLFDPEFETGVTPPVPVPVNPPVNPVANPAIDSKTDPDAHEAAKAQPTLIATSDANPHADMETTHPDLNETQAAPAASTEITPKAAAEPEPPKIDKSPPEQDASRWGNSRPGPSGPSETF